MLPAYRVNPMLDLSPISSALTGYQQQMNTNDQLNMQQKRLDMEQTKFNDERIAKVEQELGNLGYLYLTNPGKYDSKWAGAVQELVSRGQKINPNFSVPQEYFDPKIGAHVAISKSGMVPQYLDWQLRKSAEGRASAAEGRAAAMHVPQLEMAQLQYDAAKREFDTPKVGTADLGSDHARVFYNPRTGVEIGRLDGPRKGVDKEVASIEHQLRGEVGGVAKDYRVVRDSAANVEALSKTPSAASDIALIFQYMKILDPQSVVREGEFATAQNAAGVPDRIMNIYNRIISGQRLNEAQRVDFVNQARTLATTKLDQYRRDIDQYRGVAERSKVNPRNVILDQELLSPQGQTAAGNSGQGLPVISDPAQARTLPPGSMFRTPDGRILRVPGQ